MDQSEIGIKQMVFMNYRNHDSSCISVLDFIRIYCKKYREGRDFLQLYFINASGVLVIDEENIKLYFMSDNNKLNVLTINEYEDNGSFKYEGDDMLLSIVINNSGTNLLNKLYVKINSCPIEMQEELHTYRDEALEKRKTRKRDFINQHRHILLRKKMLERRRML